MLDLDNIGSAQAETGGCGGPRYGIFNLAVEVRKALCGASKGAWGP